MSGGRRKVRVRCDVRGLVWLTALVSGVARGAWAAEAPAVVKEVRQEVTKSNADAGGRPLPVASHWARSFGGRNFSSEYQVSMLEQGHHVMPNLDMPSPGAETYEEKGREVVRKLAEWRAPFSLRGGQWEQLLLSKDHPRDDPGKWRNLPLEKTPLLVDLTGRIDNWISPFGAVEPWREVGRYYASSGSFDQLQQWYPDPPLVIFLSNNEARRLKPKHKVEERSKRYVDKYGTGRPGAFQRGVMAEAYLERYAALLKGMREGLRSERWRRSCLLVAYNALGPPHFGRWEDWPSYSWTTEDRIDPWHLVWEGGSVSYYTHNWNASTDYRVWSPQIEAMNWVFMLEEAYEERPDFWFELSVWDGNSSAGGDDGKQKRNTYLEAGQQWSPGRYGGFVQYGMWLTRPRVVREFRGHGVPREEFREYFAALLAAVDRVWKDPVLRRFWRKGKLVPNHSREHPYQTRIPEKWRGVDRWYLLNTSADPPGEWGLMTEVPVFSLARAMGREGNREWLLYAHAPAKGLEGVEIEIPDYGTVTVDVTPAGRFYHVREKGQSVTLLNGGGR